MEEEKRRDGRKRCRGENKRKGEEFREPESELWGEGY